LPYRIWHEAFGAAQPIAGTVFTLVFIASALFLLAGRAVLGDAARSLTRIGAWLAPLLFAMYARYFIDGIADWFSFLVPAERFRNSVEIVMRGVPLASGVLLLLLALRPWRELGAQPANAPAS
jgi:PAT family beta-lactamase induction signal transducer AmpG